MTDRCGLIVKHMGYVRLLLDKIRVNVQSYDVGGKRSFAPNIITSKTNRIYIRKYKTSVTVQYLHSYEQKSPSAMDLGHIHDKTPRRTMAPEQLQNLHHSPTTQNNTSFFTMMHKPPVISRSPCMT